MGLHYRSLLRVTCITELRCTKGQAEGRLEIARLLLEDGANAKAKAISQIPLQVALRMES